MLHTRFALKLRLFVRRLTDFCASMEAYHHRTARHAQQDYWKEGLADIDIEVYNSVAYYDWLALVPCFCSIQIRQFLTAPLLRFSLIGGLTDRLTD
jgi:hypothetical protein